jgi:hypothetical protein
MRLCAEMATNNVRREDVFVAFSHEAGEDSRPTPAFGPHRWFRLGDYRIARSWLHWQDGIDAARSEPAVRERLFRGDNDKLERSNFNNSICAFVSDYLAATVEDQLWSDELFDSLFARFASSIRTGRYSTEFWVAAHNLELASELPNPLRTAPGVALVTPDSKTRLELIDRLRAFMEGLPSFEEVLHPLCFVRIRRHLALGSRANPNSIRKTASLQLAALRLAAGGYAHLGEVVELRTLGEYRTGERATVLMSAPQVDGSLPAPCFIRSKDVDRFRDFVREMPRVDQEFGRALERFLTLATKPDSDERLVDAVIGLENVLLPDEDLGFYQLTLRGAWVLSPTDVAVRKKIKDSLSAAVSRRHKLVHGRRDLPPVSRQHQKRLDEAPDLLARVLVRALESKLGRSAWKRALIELDLGDSSHLT